MAKRDAELDPAEATWEMLPRMVVVRGRLHFNMTFFTMGSVRGSDVLASFSVIGGENGQKFESLWFVDEDANRKRWSEELMGIEGVKSTDELSPQQVYAFTHWSKPDNPSVEAVGSTRLRDHIVRAQLILAQRLERNKLELPHWVVFHQMHSRITALLNENLRKRAAALSQLNEE